MGLFRCRHTRSSTEFSSTMNRCAGCIRCRTLASVTLQCSSCMRDSATRRSPGAENTSIVGANGVLHRVAEDGVLTDAFQKPHPRFGTSYRIINLVVGMQLLTIVLTRGNVFTLAGLYAFGVVWSFALMALAVLVLRYTEPSKREWKVPLNIPLGRGRELPLGVILIAIVLFITAVVNFFTKYEATIGGVTFR